MNNNLFYDTFVGELIEITTKIKVKTSVSNEEATTEQESPVILEMFLLDYDNDYYYLGKDSHAVTSAIKREQVSYLHIIEPKSVFDDMLDQMDTPDDEGIN